MRITRWLRQRWTLLFVIVAAVYVTNEVVGCVLEGRLSNWVLFAVAGGWVALFFLIRLGSWLHYQEELGEDLERRYFREHGEDQ